VIKAVFFDWFNTLVHYDPPREETYRKALNERGIDVSYAHVSRGLAEGDRQFFALKASGTLKYQKLEDIEDVLILYPQAICNAAGTPASTDLYLEVIRQVLKNFNSRMVLYDDVLPLFTALKKRNLILGVITNADESVNRMVDKLGLRSYLKTIITSEQVKAEKPSVVIFKAAFNDAGVSPDEMIYVGDTYKSDVLGANQAGSKGVLLDRYNLETDKSDCIRISNLQQVLTVI
jgi:putative hydrolase of the HAD superfamily